MAQKMSLLVRSEILRHFLNILFANDKYSRHKMENLMQVILMQISQKLKTFCGILFAFSKTTLNLPYFAKKSEPHTLSVYHSHATNTLLKSARKLFDPFAFSFSDKYGSKNDSFGHI